MLSNQAQNYRISKSTPLRYGNAPPNVVPYQSFKTTNGHVILAIGNDRQFRKFCEAANAPSLPDDARFNTCAARVLNREELVPLLSELMERKSTEYWCEILEPIGVPCRSEEHTSELQSLMRISYAVFCLKTKTLHIHTHHITQTTSHYI